MTILDLQKRLKALGFDPGPLDGQSGPQTTGAIRAFQSAFGLVVDGVAGPQTRAALKQATEAPAPGRTEPDKTAMQGGTVAVLPVSSSAAPPPNAASLLLRDTARAISEIVVHCAATPEGKDFTVADIRAWHKARGWSDIGYHYVVYRDGRVMEGRPIGQIGAHVSGRNTGTIGVCYVGGVSADGKVARDTRTAAQHASLLWLVERLAAKFKVGRISGHNEFAAKACPSFSVPADALGGIAGFARGRRSAAAQLASAPSKAPEPQPDPVAEPTLPAGGFWGSLFTAIANFFRRK